MITKALPTFLTVFLLFSASYAQRAELTVSLNETLFDALLDSVFQNVEPFEFPLSQNGQPIDRPQIIPASFDNSLNKTAACTESVRIMREVDGVRTAVRFRDGKIYVPLAFTGRYSPPLVGCVDFAGWAESNIDLEFDEAGQRVIGRVRVLNVNLSGTGGIGGTVIAKMIQGAVDKRLNPIEVVSLDKLHFMLPIRGSGRVRARAVTVRPEVGNTTISLHITYSFEKG